MKVELRQLICDQCGAESRVFEPATGVYKDLPSGWEAPFRYTPEGDKWETLLNHACPRCVRVLRQRPRHAPSA